MHFKYIKPFIENEVAKEKIAGANILLLKQNKEIYFESIGYADKENGFEMKRDTIFRLFSMTKPITAVAAMILYERGDLHLFDPVSKYLPGFKNQRVYLNQDNSLDTEPVRSDITIQQLLNMTSGLTYPGETDLSSKTMAELFEKVKTKLEAGAPTSTYDFCNMIGEVPLLFHPGTSWNYGTSADVLGGIIEIVSGMNLEEFYQKEIFEPLQMQDTSFFVPDHKRERLSQIYEYRNQVLVPYLDNYLGLNNYESNTAFLSGGAGLVSTIDDYAKFASMLLNYGNYNGKRLLGRKTVEYITKNQLTPEQMKRFNWPSLWGYGYGNLMRMMIDPAKAASNGTVGEYGWDGWTGNYVSINPEEQLVILYFIQKTNTGTDDATMKLRNIIYGGL